MPLVDFDAVLSFVEDRKNMSKKKDGWDPKECRICGLSTRDCWAEFCEDCDSDLKNAGEPVRNLICKLLRRVNPVQKEQD